MKRILFALLLCMGLSVVSVSAAEMSNSADLYMNRLKALEILPEDFDAEHEVTRGEMADIACKIYGMEIDDNGRIFSDVPADHPYYKAIGTAYSSGFISGMGNGKFEPDELITKEQMAKILYGLAGYDVLTAQYGGYGYMNILSDNDIIGSAGAKNTVDGAALVHSVYKAMTMPVVHFDSLRAGYTQYKTDSENTLLSNLMLKKDLYYTQGIVNFNGITYINKSESPDYGYAEVNGERFKCDADIKAFLGECVEYWVDKNKDSIVYMYEYKDRNFVYKASSNDIIEASFDRYVIYEGGERQRTIRLDTAINLIYNGQGMESFSADDLIPSNGDVTFIDNDSDNKAEVIIVNDKRYYVVDDTGRGGLSVKYKKYGTQNESGYNINEDELGDSVYYIVYDESGKEISPENISVGSVVSVMKSPNEKCVIVIVTKKKVDGKIEQLGADYIWINGTEYDIAKDADGNSINLDVRAGQTTEAYLNENGEVVYCDEAKNSNTFYAYIISEWLNSNEETYYVRLVQAGAMGSLTNKKYWWVSDKLVQNSGIFTYAIDEKAKIDGVKNTPELIESIQNAVCEIKLKKDDNENDIISSIDILKPVFQYTKGKYNHNTGALVQSDLNLTSYDNPAILLNGNIKTLVVPSDTSVKYSNDCYEAKYRIENDVATHNVAFYNIPEGSQTPKLIVMKTVLSESGTAGGDNETCIVTDSVRKGIDNDNDVIYKVNVYDRSGNASELTIRKDVTFADSSIKNNASMLSVGDVIEINRDGQNRVMDMKVIASASKPIDGTQMGIVEKLQNNVIWNKSNGDEFYNVFFYRNNRGERIEAGTKADYPIFCYHRGKKGYIEKITAADVITDEDGIYADTVIIAGDIAIILPVE